MRSGSAGETVVDADTAGRVTVEDAENGLVRYEWGPSDTAESGFFQAEFEVEYSDGAIETFPNDGYIGVSVRDDIA